jgi:hypothetical protein
MIHNQSEEVAKGFHTQCVRRITRHKNISARISFSFTYVPSPSQSDSWDLMSDPQIKCIREVKVIYPVGSNVAECGWSDRRSSVYVSVGLKVGIDVG